ncbi:hypothetical protein [Cytobacillus gottheilii]|uniref:Uncharacterized protein n=1 Tax=Cytobacillus gottheilii TaxID=859144 RepID=A0ABX8FG13_9BACI|nr:hypothetical protein [Cytobacillus gottheilii]QVY62973.1 hypothetical protein J1899_08000 [Cytobacillus gottheilii]
MPFQPLHIPRAPMPTVTLDKALRLSLGRGTIVALNISPSDYVVVSVDVENKRLGIAKQELAKVPGATAVKMDKRGYLGTAIGRLVASKLGMSESDLPIRFVSDGQVDEGTVHWHAFQAE